MGTHVNNTDGVEDSFLYTFSVVLFSLAGDFS